MEVRRIGPDGGLVREIRELRRRISSGDTRSAGNIVIRERLTTTDPSTGVSATFGQLPDGSYGFQPFIGDTEPPPVATTPNVAVIPGNFTVTWNGSFVADEPTPRDFQHVNVIGHQMDGVNTVLSVPMGVIRTYSEAVIIAQDVCPVGTEWQFSLESEDYNGNKAVRSARTASVTMESVVTDAGVNEALEALQDAADAADLAAQNAQDAADAAQNAADDAAQAALDAANLADSKGVVYSQAETPAADYSGLWIDTAHNNIPRRYLGTRKALAVNYPSSGSGAVATRLTSIGFAVSAVTATPSLADAAKYDLVVLDAGYNGLSSGAKTLAAGLHERGISLLTTGNDTTSIAPLYTGTASRGTPKNNIRWVSAGSTGPSAYADYADSDLALYLTGVNSAAKVTGTMLVTSTGADQPVNLIMEHPTNFSRWAHVFTYNSPATVLNPHIGWISDNWVAIQDQGVISAASAAVSAQTKADQAFNNAATAAEAAGDAQDTADGKNTSWYVPTAPAGTGHKVGDLWFDTDDNYKLRTWNGSIWQTTQDAWTAQQTADSKGITYTQATVPPVEARLPQNLWNDTSLGLDKVVVKYWSTTAGAWTPLADKTATEARTVADSKGETIYSTTEPAADKRLPQNLWIDTTGGINLNKRWDGAAWVVVADLRIATTATAVTAADAKAQTALNDAATKSIVYTQSTTPPVSARLPQTVWNDTSLGLNNVVVKYWNGSAWTSLADKTATDAQITADAKGEIIYSDTQPAAAKQLTQNLWVDTTGGINITKRWTGSTWAVVADSRIATTAAAVTAVDAKADAKSVVYTQSTTPPVEARLPQTIWNDTSLGLNNVVVKYWNGSAWTSLADKAATDAAAVANSKGEIIYSTSAPAAAKQLTQNLWVDTTGGLNLTKRWDGAAWVIVSDSRIATTATAVTAAQQTADNAATSAAAKSVVYTQATTPPVEARLPQTLWNDTTLGLNNIVVKYWNGSAWTPLADKTATDAQAAADSKGEVIYSDSAPAAAKQLAQNLWVDTTGGLNLHKRWTGSAWAVVADARIAQTVTQLSAITAQVSAVSAQADRSITTFFGTSTPATPESGDLWLTGVAGEPMKRYNGSAWVAFEDPNVQAAYTKAGDAQAAADAKVRTFAQTSAPTGMVPDDIGDLWIDIDDKNKLYRYDGAGWVAVRDDTIADAQGTANTALSTASSAVTAAGAAQTTADGKNTSYYQTSQPTGGTYKVGDLWFDTDDNYKMRTYAGSGVWQLTQDSAGAITTAATDATAKANAAQMASIQALAYSLNASFEDWTSTYPVGFGAFNAAPTKETTTVLTGKNAMRFNLTDTTTQAGVTSGSILAHAPNLDYVTLELDVRLDSGSSFGGSGVLIDWTGMTGGNRATVSLAAEIPTPTVGKWYRLTKVIQRPATATGTLTGYNVWLMGQYSSGMGTMSVKNVVFDWLNIRPSTTEEITAFGTPATITALTSTVNTKTKSWFQPSQPSLSGNTTGDLWFDTDDNNKVYIWNGAWSVASDQRIETINTAVTAAQASANGKNKVIYSTSAASGTTGYTAGDTWFQRDATDATKIIAQWEFTTSWQSRQLNHQVVATLDASKIVVGTLDVANRIAANAITTNKLTVSDMEDFIPNPFFHPSGEPVYNGTIVTTANTPVSAGAPYPNAILFTSRDNHPFAFPNIPVKPGDQFYLEVWVASAPTAIRNFNLYMFGSNTPVGGLTAKVSTGNLAPSAAWRKVTWNYTVPVTNPGFNYIRPVLQINNSGGETAAQMEWYATGLSMKRKNTGELIVDGAIKANSAIIENGAIGNAHIGDLAVGTAEIQDLAVQTAKINDLAITNAKIDDLAVTNAKIANATIDHAKIGSVDAGKITVGLLQGWQIAANAIDASKLNVSLGGSNLVANSSFEADSNADGLADAWATWTRGAGDAGRTFANTRPAGLFPGSTFAQRVTSNNVTNTEQSSIQSTTLFAIGPSVSATISVYGRASVAGNFSISIRCEDDLGAYKGDASFIAAFTTSTQRFTGTVITPAGTTRGKITVTTPGSLTSGHWFEVDGIQAELGNVASSWGPMTEELLPGTIKGVMIDADAINGKTITGATIQTETTANRGIKLTTTEFAGYDGAGVKNFSLTSAGALSIRGALQAGTTIDAATITGTSGIQTSATAARGVKMTNTGVSAFDNSGNMTFRVDGTTGIVEAPGILANSIKGDKIQAGTVSADKLLISDFTNLLDDASIVGPGWVKGSNPASSSIVADANEKVNAWRFNAISQQVDVVNTNVIPVVSTDRFVLSMRAYSTLNASGYLRVNWYNESMGFISLQDLTVPANANAWTSYSIANLTPPATAKFMKIQPIIGASATSGYILYGSMTLRRRFGGELIVDGAINGQTITGATIQTETTASRGIKLTTTEFAGYDGAGVKNFSLTSAGVLAVRGSIQAGTTIDGATITGTTGIQTSSAASRGVKITNTGVSAFDNSGNMTFKVDGTTGIVEAPGMKANSITGDKIAAKTIGVDKLTVQDFSNYVENPGFETGDLTGWDVVGGWYVNNAAPHSGTYKALTAYTGLLQSITNKAEVTLPVGGKVRVKVRIYSEAPATSGVQLGIALYNSVGGALESVVNVAQTGSWVEIDRELTAATAGAKRLQFFTTGAGAGGYVRLDSVVMNRMMNGELIVDGAIDGKTITGALIQTEATASRGIKLTSTELAGYDTSGLKNFSLTSAGALTLVGAIGTGSTITGTTITGSDGLQTSVAANRGVKINNAGVSAYDAGGNMTFKVDGNTGVVEAPGMKANSITGTMIAGQTITANNLFVADFANLATIDELNNITITSYGQTMVSAGYNKLVNDAGAFLMFTEKRGPVPFVQGDTLYYEFTVKASSATTSQFGVWTYDAADANASTVTPSFNIGTTDTPISGQLVLTSVKANATKFTLGFNGAANKGLQVKGVKVYKKYGGQLIVDGAIDGKTITGATIQTETTASRGIKLTTTELAGYDTGGVKNFSLTSAGTLTVRGAIQAGTTIDGATITGTTGLQTSATANRGVKINNNGVSAYDGSGNLTVKIDGTTGIAELPGLKVNSVKGDKIETNTLTADKVLISGSNLHTDPKFVDAASWMLDTGVTVATTGGKNGGGSLSIPASAVQRGGYYAVNYPDKRTVVKPKGIYRVTVAVKSVSAMPASAASVWVRAYKPDNTMAWATPQTIYSPAIAANTWGEIVGNFEIPDGYTQIAVGLYKEASFNAAVTYSDVFVQESATSELIVDGAITTTHMTSNTINGAVISTGTLNGAKIVGKSILADKLVISSTDNLVVEADFSNGGASWGTLNANKAINATAGRGSLPALRVTGSTALQSVTNLSNKVTVGSEDRFRGSFYIRSSVAAASGVAKLRMNAYTTATANTSVIVATSQAISANVYTLVEGYSPLLPANTIAVEFVLEVQNAASGTITDIDYVAVTRAADGKLVVDGAIDGKTITGALFQTDNSPLESSASRGIKLNSSGLKAYNPFGVKTFGIDALTGEVTSSGTFATSTSEFVEGGGTMTIGATFGNFTYDSHTEFTGIPGIKFTRTHSSEGEKSPASIMYDGSSIILSTYNEDSAGFVPNLAAANISVGDGLISMGAGTSLGTWEETEPLPKPHFEMYGGDPNNSTAYAYIRNYFETKYQGDWYNTGFEVSEWWSELPVNGGYSAALFNRSNQYMPNIHGSARMEVGPAGAWKIQGRRNSDGVETTRIDTTSTGATGEFGVLNIVGTEGVRIFGSGDGFLGNAIVVDEQGINITGDVTVNGAAMGAGQSAVHTMTVSGTMAVAAVPVPQIGTLVTDATLSTATLCTPGTGQITITEAGVYDFSFNMSMNAPMTGRSFLDISPNGGGAWTRYTIAVNEDTGTASINGVKVDAGQVVKFFCFQTSGGTRGYTATVRLVKVGAPSENSNWTNTSQTVDGDVIITGSLDVPLINGSSTLLQHAEFTNTQSIPNNTNWGPGTFVLDSANSINPNFATAIGFDQIQINQTGIYQIDTQVNTQTTTATSTQMVVSRNSDGQIFAAGAKPVGAWEWHVGATNAYLTAGDTIRWLYFQNNGASQSWITRVRITKVGALEPHGTLPVDSLTLTDDLTVGGTATFNGVTMDKRPLGMVGVVNTAGAATGITSETALDQLNVTVVAGRTYRVYFRANVSSVGGFPLAIGAVFKTSTVGSSGVSGTSISSATLWTSAAGNGLGLTTDMEYYWTPASSGSFRLFVTATRAYGSGTISIDGRQLAVEDKGTM